MKTKHIHAFPSTRNNLKKPEETRKLTLNQHKTACTHGLLYLIYTHQYTLFFLRGGESINQSIDQSNKRQIYQTINESTNHLNNQSNQSNNQTNKQKTNKQTISQSINKPINQSTSHNNNQSNNQTNKPSITGTKSTIKAMIIPVPK